MTQISSKHRSEEDVSKFKEILAEYELSEYFNDLLPYLKQQVNLCLDDEENYTQVGNSRFGGWPDLPPKYSWPKDKADKYLIFIAQINLADIALLQNKLPKEGILYFFLGGIENTPYSKVEYFHLQELERVELKSDLTIDDFSISFMDDSFFNDIEDDLLFSYPHKINFTKGLGLPQIKSPYFKIKEKSVLDVLKSKEIDWDTFIRLRAALATCYSEKQYSHQMLGYPVISHKDPLQMGKEINAQNPESSLLLELEEDELGFLSYMMGTCSFVISNKDLKQLDFSNIYTYV